MSPRWATVVGYGLYFCPAERHRRPPVEVRRGTDYATIDVPAGEVLAGELPPAVLRAVRELLASIVRKQPERSTRPSNSGSPGRSTRTKKVTNDKS